MKHLINSTTHLFTIQLPILFFLLTLMGPLSMNAQEIPTGGVDLINPDTGNASVLTFYGNTVANHSIVDVTGQSFSRAHRIEVFNPTGSAVFYSAAIQTASINAVNNGDVALIHFWMKVESAIAESGEGYCQVYVQKNSDDYHKSFSAEVKGNADGQWHEYFFPFVFDQTLETGAMGINFGFGAGDVIQTLQIGAVQLLNYENSLSVDELPETALTYSGRNPDAPWRIDAAARIEEHRRQSLVVKVVDMNGLPITDASIAVIMREHEFQFGSAMDPYAFLNNATYQQKIVENFNAASTENALKWPAWIGDWGSNFNQTSTMNGLQWLKDQGISIRGHVLIWPSQRNMPNFTHSLFTESTVDQLKATIISHIDDITTTVSPWVQEWDVINEPYDNHEVMDLAGDQVMVEWFERARQNLPDAKLYLNDYSILSSGGRNLVHQDFLANTVQYLLDNEAPITGIGLQGHMGATPTDIPVLFPILERFAAFGLDIRVTEFDIDTTDEVMQGDYTRDFLTMLFSHPAVVGVQVWGFWENDHWRPDAAMFRADWTPKPNAQVWQDLIYNQWWTDESGIPDDRGSFRIRPFRGTHEVSVTWQDQTVTRTIALEDNPVLTTFAFETGQEKQTVALFPAEYEILSLTYHSDEVSSQYQLQESTDMQTWTNLGDAHAGNGSWTTVEIQSDSSAKYFRIKIIAQ